MNATVRRFAFLTLLGLGVPLLHAQREKLPPDDLEIVEKRWPNAKRTYTGLRYIVLQPPGKPDSPTPVPGMMVSVAYKGMLLNGTVFDEKDASDPLKIRLGRGHLVAGWEEALQRMHQGEKWLLIVPHELGYGSRGRSPDIPRSATLVFEMELIDFSAD